MKKSKRKRVIFPKVFFILFLLVGLGIAVSFATYRIRIADRAKAAGSTGLGSNFVEVGPEEVVMDVGELVTESPILGIDAPVVVMKTTSGVQGYIAAPTKKMVGGRPQQLGPGVTYRFSAPSLDTLFSRSARERFVTTLDPKNTPTKMDSSGAWLTNALPLDSNVVLGWYHAETPSGSDLLKATMRQFAVISRDGGKSWTSLGPVMTLDPKNSEGANIPADAQFSRDDINTGTVVRSGDFYYMGFLHLMQKVGFARAKASDVNAAMINGRTGEELWKKYLCVSGSCGFTSPGIGGAAQSITNAAYGQGFAWNTKFNRFITANNSARWGLQVSLSKNSEPVSWNDLIMLVPPVSTSSDPRVDDWSFNGDWLDVNGKNPSRLSRLAYSSIIAPDGSMGSVGNEFYIYYGKNPEFRNQVHWWVMRRKVTIHEKKPTVEISSIVPLVEYKMKTGAKTRTSIDNPSRLDYQRNGTVLGWLASQKTTGLQPLYETYYDGWDDYMIVNEGGVQKSADGTKYTCRDGKEGCFIRLLGFVSPTKTALATIPLGECIDTKNLNHYYVTRETKPGGTSGACGTNKESWTYGWLFDKSALQSSIGSDGSLPDLPVSYVSKNTNGKYKSRLVTMLSKDDATLSAPVSVGKIYSKPGSGRKALHECYLQSWDDYMVATFDTDVKPATFCPNTTPNWKEVYTGVIGYVATANSATTPNPLQGCFDEANLNHYYVTNVAGCQAFAETITPKGKAKTEWLYGWLQ